MSMLKKLPFVSLALLLLTYTSFGWVISKAFTHWVIWLLVVIAVLVLVRSLTTPWRRIADYSFIFFKLNFRSFSLALLGAFLFFLMIAKFRVFLDTLLVIAAVVLARLDFQAAGFSEGQTFWLLSIFSLVGLGVGVLIHRFI